MNTWQTEDHEKFLSTLDQIFHTNHAVKAEKDMGTSKS